MDVAEAGSSTEAEAEEAEGGDGTVTVWADAPWACRLGDSNTSACMRRRRVSTRDEQRRDGGRGSIRMRTAHLLVERKGSWRGKGDGYRGEGEREVSACKVKGRDSRMQGGQL